MVDKKLIWVTAKRPVGLVNTHTLKEDGDYWRIEITQKMIDAGIAIQLPDDLFVRQYLTQGLLQEVKDAGIAKKENENYFKKVAAEAKAEAEEKAKEARNEQEAIKVAKEAYREKMEALKAQGAKSKEQSVKGTVTDIKKQTKG